ncbi:MAG: VOC family protein [Azonexus sp.]|jgi:predicted enzyme related to lactoylglutathione lyase|uniref:VOC family protein n=1 Tax=Azonexus sp. TaxID=1872668 RepID=UPI0028256E23|nr:VOC family protein [Azonexus sp.]MDR0775816.1 VOC family protein [Azonexus sp.]
MRSIINWFEIPVTDIERATRFYETVFATTLIREEMENMQMAVFPYEDGQASGGLTLFEHYKPSADGVVIYLDAPRLDAMLERVKKAGGQLIFGPETLPKNIGRIALIIDSEGNRIGLHEEP